MKNKIKKTQPNCMEEEEKKIEENK